MPRTLIAPRATSATSAARRAKATEAIRSGGERRARRESSRAKSDGVATLAQAIRGTVPFVFSLFLLKKGDAL